MVVGAWPRAHPCAPRDRLEDLELLTPGPQLAPLRVRLSVAQDHADALLIGNISRPRGGRVAPW